jgi:hypothetical protein
MINLKLFFFYGLLSLFFSFQQERDWVLKKEEQDIRVYSRIVEDSDVREMRAITTLNVSMNNLIALIRDVEYYPRWVYRCSEAYVIKRISETEIYYYQVISAPWPISDRDMIIHAEMGKDEDGTIHIRLKGVPDYLDVKPDRVRIKKFKGKWILKPTIDGKIQVVQDVLVIPSGNVPSWAVNLAAVEGPFGTFLGMKNIVHEERFANHTFGFTK